MSLKVLVVEDHPDIRELLKLKLSLWGYSVRTAIDGEEALARIAEETPDLMLLDMALPKIDGFEVARRVRQNPATASLPVIALTALGQTSDRARCLGAGCTDYLSKPFSFEILRSRIEFHAAGSRATA